MPTVAILACASMLLPDDVGRITNEHIQAAPRVAHENMMAENENRVMNSHTVQLGYRNL